MKPIQKKARKAKTIIADLQYTKSDGDLNSIDWDGNSDVNPFNTYLDRCELSQEQVKAMERRIEASSKRFPF